VFFRDTQPNADLTEGRRRLASKVDTINAVADPAFRIADYGTRRRFSRVWQDEVIRTLKEGIGRKLVGTSNVEMAMRHALTPLGTMAHEYLQACQAVGPRAARFAGVRIQYLGARIPGRPRHRVIGRMRHGRVPARLRSLLLQAVRWRSSRFGDPFEWGEKLIAHYQKMRIDPHTKAMVFSDSLDVPLAIRLFEYFRSRMQTAFGIGTNLTNDCRI
jgi:nicotinate phosphoribosyltransferase